MKPSDTSVSDVVRTSLRYQRRPSSIGVPCWSFRLLDRNGYDQPYSTSERTAWHLGRLVCDSSTFRASLE